MSDLRILVKLPTRGRPEQFRKVATSMLDAAQDRKNIGWCFSFDQDDKSAEDAVEFVVAAFGMCGHKAEVFTSKSDSKIHAINRDINECKFPWDILVVGSDDMFPVAQGWDTVIREAMEKHFPDTDGMLWFPDGHQKSITTMPIMGRKLYQRFGAVYHPSYRSFFCDNEQTEIAQAYGKLVYIDRQLFDHRHPDNGVKVARDETYKRANKDWDADKRNYMQRRRNGFPQ